MYIDIHVDGNYYDKVEQKDVLGKILSLLLTEVNYMSVDAMKEALISATDLAAESSTELVKCATLLRKVTFIRDYLRVKTLNRTVLLNLITNTILSSEGLGTLSGFGYSSKNSGYRINPEIVSMRSVE